MTHTLYVSRWNWDEEWKEVGSCPPSSVEFTNGLLAWERESELSAMPPCPRTDACVPPKLQTSSTSPCKTATSEAILGVYTKNRKEEAQFWVPCKFHKTPVSKLHTVWFSRPKWQIPDHITGAVIEVIKQPSRDTDYQRILLSAAIKGIGNKQEQQKLKDQWHQLIPNNLKEKQMPWTGRKRSLSTQNRYINLKNPRWCSHWEKQMHRAGKAAG